MKTNIAVQRLGTDTGKAVSGFSLLDYLYDLDKLYEEYYFGDFSGDEGDSKKLDVWNNLNDEKSRVFKMAKVVDRLVHHSLIEISDPNGYFAFGAVIEELKSLAKLDLEVE